MFEVPIQIVGEKPVLHRIHVIQQCEQTLLLGRHFIRLFNKVVFSWEKGTIELGRANVATRSTVTGGDPLFRAQTVMRVEANESQNGTFYPHLDVTERQKLEESLEEFNDMFNERPGRAEKNVSIPLIQRQRPR